MSSITLSADFDSKYDDEPRLPSFEEALTEERLLMERAQLMEATKQLARIQMDMEAKVRAEMEIKIRAEMEAKMRSEVLQMEEDKKAQEIRRQLEEQKKKMRDELVAFYQKQVYSTPTRSISNCQLEFIEKNNILTYTPVYWVNHGSGGGSSTTYLGLYMTDTCFGIHLVFNDTQYENRPFYWFDSELTLRDLTILMNYGVGKTHPITRTTHYTNIGSSPLQHLKYMYYRHFGGNNIAAEMTSSIDAANFETIVRFIPGSYRNGSWRPLAGFFGPYLNEETLEITTIVPILE